MQSGTTLTTTTLNTRRIVVAGVLVAIVILLGVTRLGFIPVPTPAGNATILHIPAIVGSILEGWIVGAIISTLFGVISFLQGGGTAFADPLVAILPRIFIGITPFFVYRALRSANGVIGYGIAALIGLMIVVFLVFAPSFAPAKPVVDFGSLHLEGDAALTVFQITGGLLVLFGLLTAGLLAFFAYRNQMELLAIAAAAIVGTLTNTVLVLTMLVVRGYLPATVALGVGITHGIPEIIVAVVVTVAVVAGWKRLDKGAGRSSV